MADKLQEQDVSSPTEVPTLVEPVVDQPVPDEAPAEHQPVTQETLEPAAPAPMNQYPGVPRGASPEDADRVLGENGHNRRELVSGYEGEVSQNTCSPRNALIQKSTWMKWTSAAKYTQNNLQNSRQATSNTVLFTFQVVYKDRLLRYQLKGEVRWRGLRTKWKWRCTVSGAGVRAESDWFEGRPGALGDALRKTSL